MKLLTKISTYTLDFLTTWSLGSRREPGLSCISFYDLALKLVQHHFYLILSIETVTKIHQEHKLHLLMEESQHLKRVPHSLFLWH